MKHFQIIVSEHDSCCCGLLVIACDRLSVSGDDRKRGRTKKADVWKRGDGGSLGRKNVFPDSHRFALEIALVVVQFSPFTPKI